MRRLFTAVVLLALASRGGAVQPPRVPVLVELYTSEGCSSCPPADTLLSSLVRDQPIAGVEVIPIGLHVDYFNDLGWKDAFSSAAFTARQRSYSTVFGDENMYTPQMVVDGEVGIPGIETDTIRHAIGQAADKPHLALRVSARESGGKAQLTIDCPATPPDTEKIQVMAAITEDGLSSVVTRGENHGRTLHHAAVARRVQSLTLGARSAIQTSQMSIEKGWGKELKAVVWLQGTKSRQVYGAASAAIAR